MAKPTIISVTGSKISLGATFSTEAENTLRTVTGKYFRQPVKAELVVSREGPGFYANIVAHPGKNVELRALGKGGNVRAAFGDALESLERQLKKAKTKTIPHKSRKTDRARKIKAGVLADPSLTTVMPFPESMDVSERDAEKTALAEMGIQHLTPLVAQLPNWKPEPQHSFTEDGPKVV